MEMEEVIYNNVVYYRKPNHHDIRCKYFRRRGRCRDKTVERYLHRQVWVDHFGKIPEGFHIHHKNHDVTNNLIDNLECISRAKHFEEHKAERLNWAFSKENKANLDKGRIHGINWMKTDMGRDHAKKLGIIQKEKSKKIKQCVVCLTSFEAYDLIKVAMYCSNDCLKIAAKGKKKTIVCEICHKSIEINRYSKSTCCYGKCTALKGHNTRLANRLGT